MGTKAFTDMKSPVAWAGWLVASKCWSDQTGAQRESVQSREDLIHHPDFTELIETPLGAWVTFPWCVAPRPGLALTELYSSGGWQHGLVTEFSSSLSQASHLQHCSHSWLHNAENSICRFNLWWWIIFALSTNWELNPVMQRPENISKHSSCDLLMLKNSEMQKYSSFKLTSVACTKYNDIPGGVAGSNLIKLYRDKRRPATTDSSHHW